MYNVSQLLPERVARERLHRRQRAEAERRERVFNDKVRTIGVSLHFTPAVITGTNGSNVYLESNAKVLLFIILYRPKNTCLISSWLMIGTAFQVNIMGFKVNHKIGDKFHECTDIMLLSDS